MAQTEFADYEVVDHGKLGLNPLYRMPSYVHGKIFLCLTIPNVAKR